MKPRMDDERVKEALGVANRAVQFVRRNLLLDALHDLQDARKRVAELEGALGAADELIMGLLRDHPELGPVIGAKQALGEKP